MIQTDQVVIVQTHVPDYRLPFFRKLCTDLGGLTVIAGNDYFTPVGPNSAKQEDWHRLIKNIFLLNRSLLWQDGAFALAWPAGLLVLEWNPRILSSWCILLARWISGRKTLLWGHAASKWRFAIVPQFVRDCMAEIGNGIIAYTVTEAQVIRRHHPGLPVWVASNSCVTDAEIRPRSAAGEEILDVVSVGRLVWNKKPQLLIAAWARVIRQAPSGARLIIVGDGPERRTLERQVESLALQDSVCILGPISDVERLREIYQRALVAVSPGYVGLSAIQCMAFGVPMAISRTEKHSPELEVCREGFNCSFFRTDDAGDLARTLLGFYHDAGTWLGRSGEIAAAIRESYTIEKMASGYAEALKGLGPDDRPRVALVWEYYGPYHLARLRNLKQRCAAYQVVALEMAAASSSHKWHRERPADIHALEVAGPIHKLNSFTIYSRAVNFFRNAEVKVVMLPSYWPMSSLAILLAAKRVGARTVMMNDSHQHTAKYSLIRPVLKKLLIQLYDSALLAGQLHIAYFRSLGMTEAQMFDGYDVVDNAYFGTAAAECRRRGHALREQWGLPAKYFLNVGRMVAKKNLLTLIAAYRAVRSSTINCARLVLVGSGPEEEELKRFCRQAGLKYADMQSAGEVAPVTDPDTDVFFYGFRQEKDLPVFYGLAEVFILPSTSEEWGLVVNEAMASGLPVIVSATAGCAPDLVKEGETGYTFDPKSTAQLAERLGHFARNPALARTMGEKAGEWIATWGLDRFSANTERAITAALARHPRINGDRTGSN